LTGGIVANVGIAAMPLLEASRIGQARHGIDEKEKTAD
jgi:hypothetical protein